MTIAEQIFRGVTAEQLGISEISYRSRRLTIAEFLKTNPPLIDFDSEYKDWLKIFNAAITPTQQGPLLGDMVEKFTHATGLDRIAKTYTRITGNDCGCARRKEQLNEADRMIRKAGKHLKEVIYATRV